MSVAGLLHCDLHSLNENDQFSWYFIYSTPAESFLDEEERQYEEAEEKVCGDSEEVSEPALGAPGPAPAQPPDEVQPESDVGRQHGDRHPGHPGHVAQLPTLPGVNHSYS